MSYSDFLDTLISPIRLFVSALSQVADSLIHNYIIITLLGLTLFISLVWLIYYTFHDFINSKIDKIEDKLDRYKNYELYKETQREYLDKHRVDEFMYLYDLTILKQQVLNGIYRNHPDLLYDNMKNNLKMRIEVLKNINQDNLIDDDLSNDNDIDYIVPNINNGSVEDDIINVFDNLDSKKHVKDNFALMDDITGVIDSYNLNKTSENNEIKIDYPKIQKASVSELKQKQQSSWLNEYSEDLEEQIVNNVDRIMHENHDLLLKHGLTYDKKNNVFIDIKTGEVVNIPDKFDKKDNVINLGIFSYFDKDIKDMKKIALPIIPGKSLQDFQFDNDKLSDFERNFITSHTLIREK